MQAIEEEMDEESVDEDFSGNQLDLNRLDDIEDDNLAWKENVEQSNEPS